MSSVTAWVSALCFAAVACTAMRMLAPEGSLGRIFKMITMVFFICAFSLPLLSMKDMLNLEKMTLPENFGKINADSLQEEIDMQFSAQVNETVTTVCHRVLEEFDVKIEKVETKMDKDEAGSIYIDSITVYLDKDSQAKTIQVTQKLESTFGVKINVRTMRED